MESFQFIPTNLKKRKINKKNSDIQEPESDEANFQEMVDQVSDISILKELSASFKKHCLDEAVDSNCEYFAENLDRKRESPQPYYVIKFEKLGKIPKIEDIMIFYNSHQDLLFNIWLILPNNTNKKTIETHLWIIKKNNRKKMMLHTDTVTIPKKANIEPILSKTFSELKLDKPQNFKNHLDILNEIIDQMNEYKVNNNVLSLFELDTKANNYKLIFCGLDEISVNTLQSIVKSAKEKIEKNIPKKMELELKTKYITFANKKNVPELTFTIFYI
jgi:hypothetical protein